MRGKRSIPRSVASPVQAEPRWVGAAEIRASLAPERAVAALRAVLDSGFSPETDAPRGRVDTPGGSLLYMPSSLTLRDGYVCSGVKILTLTPANGVLGAPVIQGTYQFFGGPQQAPVAVLDGAALTSVRTPAVSALGAEMLLSPEAREEALRMLIIGTGVQAWEHARTFAALFSLGEIVVAGRSYGKAEALAARIRAELGVPSRAVTMDEGPLGSPLEPEVRRADLIVTCTAATEPLFRGEWVSDQAVVIAVGAHTPEARELDDTLMGRAEVLVESRSTATRESGEVIQGLENEVIVSQYSLVTLAEMTLFERRGFARPGVFTTTGMPWEDLALAAEVVRGLGEETAAGGWV
ncbi:ornithine cyclodeaminase family protein [Falsarthrobacter nasiphocae]|uniref:Ornithine cyclodeaminase n=1 Tax=Falsarthrobacter nasiphocae TaxID=189863 RepID=A0AAE3YHK0_9MICC|nr:ornithine cyclodeaminase family protein [Falsarthrobacter nasiphocae]MDR6892151.1 ornithine cyclodeaminase [Falsarthrobacter nasiphocae]